MSNPEEVVQILDLQARNHVSGLDPLEMEKQGFVTVRHDPDVLQAMNRSAPAIIAKDEGKVVGYALVMPRAFGPLVPILEPMFALLDTLSWKGTALRDNPHWFVMGQICIDADYRGQGVFDRLYHTMKVVYQPDYEFIVTEVAERNARSMRAHTRVGFETIHSYRDALSRENWRMIVWDWT